MVRAALGRGPSIRITQLVDPALWRWGLDFLGQCTAKAHRINSDKLWRLSRFSRDLLASAEDDMDLPKSLTQKSR